MRVVPALAQQNSPFFKKSVNKFCNYLFLRSESPSDKVTPFVGCTDDCFIPHTLVSLHTLRSFTFTFWKFRNKSNFAQVGLQHTYDTLMQGSPVEMQIPTQWNLIGCGMSAPPPELSPSSILLPPSFHWAYIPAMKNAARPSKTPFFLFYLRSF